MPTTKEHYDRELAVALANHEIQLRQSKLIRLLQLQLREAKGQFLSTQEKWALLNARRQGEIE